MAADQFGGGSTGVDEEAALRRVRMVSDLLDEAIRVPGTDYRIGLDPLIGAVPGGGDAVSAAVSLYIVAEAARAGVPPATLARMMANVGVDAVGGLVPVAGAVFDTVWKANKWNVELFEEHVEDRMAEGRSVPVE